MLRGASRDIDASDMVPISTKRVENTVAKNQAVRNPTKDKMHG